MTTPKQITLRLPCEVYEALEVEAEQYGMTISERLKIIVADYLENTSPQ